MIGFIEGTLLISNVLLILFSVVYGMLIIQKKTKEESSIWIYFLMASGTFFISELLTILDDLAIISIGPVKALVRIFFGILVLFAFLSKYDQLKMGTGKKKGKKT